MSLPFDVSDEWVLSSDDTRPFAFVNVFENFFSEPVTYLSSSFHLSTRFCSLFCPNLSDIALHILSIIPLPKTSLSLHCLDKEPTLCCSASPKQTGVSSCLSPLWVACQVDNHKVTHYIFPFTTTLGSPHFQWNLKHDCVLPFWGLVGWVSFPWKNIDIYPMEPLLSCQCWRYPQALTDLRADLRPMASQRHQILPGRQKLFFQHIFYLSR